MGRIYSDLSPSLNPKNLRTLLKSICLSINMTTFMNVYSNFGVSFDLSKFKQIIVFFFFADKTSSLKAIHSAIIIEASAKCLLAVCGIASHKGKKILSLKMWGLHLKILDLSFLIMSHI